MTRWAVIVLIVLALLYLATLALGSSRHDAKPPGKDAKPPAFAAGIDRLVGWAEPGIDPKQLTVVGGTWTPADHRLRLAAKASATIRVAADPDHRSRHLVLSLVEPAPAAKPAATLTYHADGPLPDGVSADDLPRGAALFPDEHAGDRDDGARRLGLPVYSVGASLAITAADRPLVIELR